MLWQRIGLKRVPLSICFAPLNFTTLPGSGEGCDVRGQFIYTAEDSSVACIYVCVINVNIFGTGSAARNAARTLENTAEASVSNRRWG